MIKNLQLLALTFLTLGCTLALATSCKQVPTNDLQPVEKGHFKISFTNLSATTRAFWETDIDKRKNGEQCERDINNITIFVYQTSVSSAPGQQCVYRRDFTSYEIEKMTAIFSLPQSAYQANGSYDFYAIANYNYPKTPGQQGPLRSELLASILGDAKAYMGITNVDDSVSNFSSIYPSVTGAAVALRRDNVNGSGFVMSSEVKTQTVPSGDVPMKVELPISRLANKTEIKAYTTHKFKENYINPYNSTLVIDSIKLLNVATKTNLFHSSTSIASQTADFQTMAQLPGKVKFTEDSTEYHSVIYGFENNFDKVNTPAKRPVLRICATYDFDGNPDTTDDITKINYSKEIALDGAGTMLRNTFYQVEVKINGLTAQEIITSITVSPWTTVATEQIEFGQ